MKIFLNNFSHIKNYSLNKLPKVSFGNDFSSPFEEKGDTFERKNQTESPKKSEFARKFKNITTKGKSISYNAQDITKELIAGISKEKNKDFINIAQRLGIFPQDLGFEDTTNAQYAKMVEEKVENSKLAKFVNSDSWLPTIEGKKPSLGLIARLKILDKFILDKKEIDEIDTPESIKRLQDVLICILTQEPSSTKFIRNQDLTLANFPFENSGIKIGISKFGQITTISKISQGKAQAKEIQQIPQEQLIKSDKAWSTNTSEFISQFDRATDKVHKKFSSKAIAKEIRHRMSLPRENYKSLINQFKLSPYFLGFENEFQKGYLDALEKRIDKTGISDFINSESWLLEFEDGTKPNLNLHARVRLLERFVLDTKNAPEIMFADALGEAKKVVATIYSKEPKRIEQREDGSTCAIFPFKSGMYFIKAIFNKEGQLATVAKCLPAGPYIDKGTIEDTDDDTLEVQELNLDEAQEDKNFIKKLKYPLVSTFSRYKKGHIARELHFKESCGNLEAFNNIMEEFNISRRLLSRTHYTNSYDAALDKVPQAFVELVNSKDWIYEVEEGLIPNISLSCRLRMIDEFVINPTNKGAWNTYKAKDRLKRLVSTIYETKPMKVRSSKTATGNIIANYMYDGAEIKAVFAADGRLVNVVRAK